MKPVDLDALKNRIHGPERPEINDGIQEIFWIEKCMNEAPVLSVDDLRPIGMLVTIDRGVDLAACSLCGHFLLHTEYNYCPNCGAKMGGKS